jgi:S-adenosylmethionine synthetase
MSDYCATGEGLTVCILITTAYPSQDDYKESKSHINPDGSFHFEMPELKEGITPGLIAKRQFAEEFGDYYALGAENLDEKSFLLRCASRLPEYVVKMIEAQKWPDRAAGNLYYASRLHVNYS